MNEGIHHEIPVSVAEAERIQAELSRHVDLSRGLPKMPNIVAGVDVSYDKTSARVAAAAVLIDLSSLAVSEVSIVHGEASFPYVPGLLAFREVPILLEALEGLTGRPDVLVCDGYGVAHPRRFGLACHLGVLTSLPTFGVAKTAFTTAYDEPGTARGEWSTLRDSGTVLGRALRTQPNIRPVFVSVGHRISLDEATSLTLRLSDKYRIPEAIRKADSLSREALRLAAS